MLLELAARGHTHAVRVLWVVQKHPHGRCKVLGIAGRKSTPVFPFLTISAMLPRLLATTGTPHAYASMIVIGMPSYHFDGVIMTIAF